MVINHPYLLSPSTTIHGILPIQSKHKIKLNWVAVLTGWSKGENITSAGGR